MIIESTLLQVTFKLTISYGEDSIAINAPDYSEFTAEADAYVNIYADTNITDDSWNESIITWNTGSPNHELGSYTITGVGTTAFLQTAATITDETVDYIGS